MSETTSSGGAHGSPLDYRNPGIRSGSSIAKIGGALGADRVVHPGTR